VSPKKKIFFFFFFFFFLYSLPASNRLFFPQAGVVSDRSVPPRREFFPWRASACLVEPSRWLAPPRLLNRRFSHGFELRRLNPLFPAFIYLSRRTSPPVSRARGSRTEETQFWSLKNLFSPPPSRDVSLGSVCVPRPFR